MNEPLTRERLNIVLVGHVDHGKSTIVGRLLGREPSSFEQRQFRIADPSLRSG